MLYETGQVVAVETDGLWVETLKQSACAKCSAKAGCGQKLLASIHPKHDMTFIKASFFDGSEVKSWKVGDQAVLGIEEHALVRAALIAYLLPLGLMLVGAGILPHLLPQAFGFGEDGAAMLGAAAGLMIGAFAVRFHSRSASGRNYYQAKVIAKALKVEN